MSSKMVLALSFAAACLTAMPVAFAQPADQMITNGPQADPGDNSSQWSATRNVRESENYDRMLETNSGFRMARMMKECGPITDPQLHASCMASFNQDAPHEYGSSTPPHRVYHNMGAGGD